MWRLTEMLVALLANVCARGVLGEGSGKLLYFEVANVRMVELTLSAEIADECATGTRHLVASFNLVEARLALVALADARLGHRLFHLHAYVLGAALLHLAALERAVSLLTAELAGLLVAAHAAQDEARVFAHFCGQRAIVALDEIELGSLSCITRESFLELGKDLLWKGNSEL